MSYGIDEILECEGFDTFDELIEEYGLESVVPGVCVQCGEVIHVEPDQNHGWCEECEKNTVWSFLMISGLI